MAWLESIKQDAAKLYPVVTEVGKVVHARRWVYPSWTYLYIKFLSWKNKTTFDHESLVYLTSRHITRAVEHDDLVLENNQLTQLNIDIEKITDENRHEEI